MNILNNVQEFDGIRYQVSELIEASKDLEVFEVKTADIFLNYESPCANNLVSFIEHCKRTDAADLKHAIILSPCNYILDGKHRVAKALIKGNKTVKAVRFKEMPNIGQTID